MKKNWKIEKNWKTEEKNEELDKKWGAIKDDVVGGGGTPQKKITFISFVFIKKIILPIYIATLRCTKEYAQKRYISKKNMLSLFEEVALEELPQEPSSW